MTVANCSANSRHASRSPSPMRDSYDFGVRCEAGQQWQLHFDGMFFSVSGRVEFADGDRCCETVGQFPIGIDLPARQRPGLMRCDGPGCAAECVWGRAR